MFQKQDEGGVANKLEIRDRISRSSKEALKKRYESREPSSRTDVKSKHNLSPPVKVSTKYILPTEEQVQ